MLLVQTIVTLSFTLLNQTSKTILESMICFTSACLRVDGTAGLALFLRGNSAPFPPALGEILVIDVQLTRRILAVFGLMQKLRRCSNAPTAEYKTGPSWQILALLSQSALDHQLFLVSTVFPGVSCGMQREPSPMATSNTVESRPAGAARNARWCSECRH